MENTISNIFDKYTQQSDTNVLDTILDDITLESAMSMNAEHQSILNAYEVMDKIQNDLTTESAISDCNSYLKETLATINLTPEYFGFEENITIESAVLTIESGDSIWKKMWEWIKEKVKQIKDWVVKVFKSIFNKSKVQFDTLEQLEKIELGKLVNKDIETHELKTQMPYLKDYNSTLLSYVKELSINNKRCFGIAELVDKNKKDLLKLLETVGKSPDGLNRQCTMAKYFGQGNNINGIFIRVTGSALSYKATYIKIIGTKINGDVVPIENSSDRAGRTPVMSTTQIADMLKELKTLTGFIKDNLNKTSSMLDSTTTELNSNISKVDAGSNMNMEVAVIKIISALQDAWAYLNYDISKLIKVTSLHMKCYETKTK